MRLRVTAPSELCCLSGRVWITCEGRCEDIVLDRNERRALGKESRVLVEALTDAVIELRREPGAMR